ncbi:hypothetical protein BZ164_03990, partial [Pseudomonas veronii]
RGASPPPTFQTEFGFQYQVGYKAASLWLLIWGAPLTTLAERRLGAWVTRQDAGLAVLGQGWPMTAAHGLQSLRSGMPSLGEAPSGGAKTLLVTFGAFAKSDPL